jgi:hypothetical protein
MRLVDPPAIGARMAIEEQELFRVRSYDDLLKGLVERRHSLGWSQWTLDQIAGWADGLTGKYEAGQRVKGFGPLGLLTALQALEIELIAVPRKKNRSVNRHKAVGRLNGAPSPLAD